MAVIEAHNLSKIYPAQSGKGALLGRGGLGRLFQGPGSPPQALAPLSLSVEPGEALGIIGRNGSGKSTLLKIIAGVTTPTTGTLRVNGRVASLLELGAGFHPMLTGRENVYLNAGLLGMRHAQVDQCFEAIVDFAELDGHMDRTVDSYSSGMFVRLAFSVAIHTNPDVFLVDEVLAVGDESFQRKCRARILELKAAGKTIVFVSHDLGIVQALCDRVLLLDDGAELSRGDTRDTIEYYLRQVGAAGGIHRMVDGDTEVLFNHGRLSLYRNQRECTTPLGIKVQFYSQGTYHESTAAHWKLQEAAEGKLTATGSFARLPVLLHLECTLAAGRLDIALSWENTQPFDLAYVALQCFLSTAYTRWYSDGAWGDFPAIGPEHHQWSTVAASRPNGWCYEVTGDDPTFPPLCFTAEGTPGRSRLQLDNGDYMTQSRIAHFTESIPSGENPLPPARRVLGTVTVDPTRDHAALEALQAQRREERHVEAGRLGIRLHDGFAVLESDGRTFSDFLHLHFQVRTGDLWLMSQDLTWEPPRKSGRQLSATGRAQRLPFTVVWTLDGHEDGTVSLQITLEASESFVIAEYNVSLCLSSTYEVWSMPSESGPFPINDDAHDGWQHCNRSYVAGNHIDGKGAGVPALTFIADTMMGPIFPTAIYTGSNTGGHVLQLLSRPDREPGFSLAADTHTLFRGRVALLPDNAP